MTSDVQNINESLVNDQYILDKLYSFIQTHDELNPLMASYFAKVIGCLISRKTDAVLENFLINFHLFNLI